MTELQNYEPVEKNGLYSIGINQDRSIAVFVLKSHSDYLDWRRWQQTGKAGYLSQGRALRDLINLYMARVYSTIEIHYKDKVVGRLDKRHWSYFHQGF